MGRKKIDFTKEQDDRITQLVNEGYSLNQILPIINGEFNTNFSRSCIDRRIKALGINRNEIVKEVKLTLSKSDIVKYLISKYFYESSNNCYEHSLSTQYTVDEFAKRIHVSKPTLLKYLNKYNLPDQITPDMKEFFDISNIDLRMYKKETVDDIVEYLKSKTNVVIEPNAIIKVGNTDVTVEMFFPEYNTVLVSSMQDDYYTKKYGETELPIKCMFKWYDKIQSESHYRLICYRLMSNQFTRKPTQYNIQYVGDCIIKDLGLKEL